MYSECVYLSDWPSDNNFSAFLCTYQLKKMEFRFVARVVIRNTRGVDDRTFSIKITVYTYLLDNM